MYYRLFHIYEQSATKLTLVIYEVHFSDDKIKDVEVGRMVSAVSTIPVDSSNGRISWACHRYAIVQFLLNDKTKYLMCTYLVFTWGTCPSFVFPRGFCQNCFSKSSRLIPDSQDYSKRQNTKLSTYQQPTAEIGKVSKPSLTSIALQLENLKYRLTSVSWGIGRVAQWLEWVVLEYLIFN